VADNIEETYETSSSQSDLKRDDVLVVVDDTESSKLAVSYTGRMLAGCADIYIRSIKEECLDRVIPLGERHFRRTVAEYVEHYHRERNHQELDNQLIAGTPAIDVAGRVLRRPRLGGLLNFYERAA